MFASRASVYALSALLLGAVSAPAFLPLEDDGFPLSTYPMFSRHRPRRVEVVSALAIGNEGDERAVPPSYVANAETMLALTTLKKSIAGGRKSARTMCDHVAREIASRAEHEFGGAYQVALVTSTVDSVKYLAGDSQPIARKVHVRCGVPGRQALRKDAAR